MLVSSTRELIEKLQEYERRNGIGAIRSIGTYVAGNRTINYVIEIANDTYDNETMNNADGHFKKEVIEIAAIDENTLF